MNIITGLSAETVYIFSMQTESSESAFRNLFYLSTPFGYA